MIRWSRHSRRTLPRNRSHTEFMSGGCTAVRRARAPSPLATRSNTAPNLSSRKLRPLPERRRVAKLLRDPRLRWSARHRDMHHALCIHVDDEEREDGTEPDIVHLQEIAGPDRVVSQECPPALSAVRSRWPRASQVPLDRALRDANAEPQELASNAFGSPEAVLDCNAPDERDDLRSKTRFACPARAGLSTSEELESLAVPSKHGLRLDQEQGMAPPRKESCEQDQQAALMAVKAGAFDSARGDEELLPKKRVLGDQFGARAGQIGDEAARDARRTATVAEPPHRPDCQAGNRCGKPGAEDAEHRAIRADPKAIIKACSAGHPG